jgi:hypothetical protein
MMDNEPNPWPEMLAKKNMIERFQTEDIELELQRRQATEYQAILNAIREHERAIQRIEQQLATLNQPDSLPPTVSAPVKPSQQQPQFGPCATSLLEIFSSSSKPISETELLRCTRYSTVMFRKAATELLNAGKILRTGNAKKVFWRPSQHGR